MAKMRLILVAVLVICLITVISGKKNKGDDAAKDEEGGEKGTKGTNDKGAKGTNDKGAKGTDEKGAKGTDEKGAKGTDEKGAKGTDGKGAKGTDVKGAKGTDEKGAKGTNDKGAKGTNDKGAKGTDEKGAKGTNEKGTKGTNEKGAKGTDEKGAKGTNEKGAKGTNEKGAKGTNEKGTKGTNEKGAKGIDKKGAKGTDEKGAKGTNEKGAKGTNEKGTKGTNEKGAKGTNEKGAKGTNEKGAKGTNEKGTKGTNEKGAKGIDKKGAKGTDEKGAKGTNEKAAKGTNEKGAKGTNDKGAKGTNDKGAKGSKGTAAAAVEECKKVTFASKRHGKSGSSRKEKNYFYKKKYMTEITSVTLRKTLNKNRCKKGETYDFTAGHVWVSRGCSFEATVCYTRGGDAGDPELCGGKRCHMNARCHKNRCRCDKGMVGDGVETCYSACQCRSYGDPHTSTNDGTMCHFQGACKYLLSRLAGIPNKPECDIDTEAKHEHRNGVTRVSFIRYLDVKVKGKIYTLAPGGDLLVDGVEVDQSYSSDDGLVEVSFYRPRTLILEVKACNYIVTYDGRSRASIIAPKEYGENLSGMCGNCNELKSDDLITPDGVDFAEFPDKCVKWGNYWSVTDDSGLALATCAQPDVQIKCTEDQNREAEGLCGRLQDPDGPFSVALQEGWVKELAESSFESCLFDVCNAMQTGGNVMATVCGMIEDFHTFLLDSEFDAVNWRTPGICPLQCGPNAEYKEVMECPRSCSHDPDEAVTCPTIPQSGCACKAGYVRSDKQCVKPEMCGCKTGSGKKTRYHKIGASFMSRDCETDNFCVHEDGKIFLKKVPVGPCHKKARCRLNKKARKHDCVCNKGLVGDGRTKCEKECMPGRRCGENARCVRKRGKSFCQCNAPLQGDGFECSDKCMCTATGDPHYLTFGGKKIHFQGVCTYTLVETRMGNIGMRVAGKNQQVEGKEVSRTKQTIVVMEPSDDIIVLDQGNKVRINGKPVVVSSDAIDMPYYTIRLVGKNVIVKHKQGDLTAMFNGKHSAKILIGKEFGPQSKGICGICDGKPGKYLTADGVDVGAEPNKYSLIGNSYWIPREDETEEQCKPDDEVPHCTKEMMTELAGSKYCGIITDETGPFSQCLKTLRQVKDGTLSDRAAELFEFCMYDTCEVADRPADVEKMKCDAIAAFKAECESYGVTAIDWRTPELCPMKCGENMRYNPSISMTQPSCNDPRLPRPLEGPISEGCECEDGFLFNPGPNTCVPPEECGCSLPTGYVAVGFREVYDKCTKEKICVLEDGAPTLVYNDLAGCRDNEVCEARDQENFMRCHCDAGFKMIDGSCQEVCENGRDKCHEQAYCRRRPGKKPRCRCNRGWRGDGIRQCKRECTCTASGDPHYKLFDGGKIHFQGRCMYRLTCAGSETCGMCVNARNQPHKKKSTVSTTKSIEVQMKPSADKIKIGQKGKVFINGARVTNFPYSTTDYTIIKRGKYTTVVSKCNTSFKATFDGNKKASVSIPTEVGPGATGICANCDNDKTNDLRVKNGTDVGDLKKKDMYNEVGNSWWIPTRHETYPECKSDSEEPVCTKEIMNVLTDEKHCGFMTNPAGPFAACLEERRDLVEGLFDDCLYDSCALFGNDTLVGEQVCGSLAALWMACADADIDYRSPEMCPRTTECTEANMVYVQHITKQQPTCQVPIPPTDDDVRPWPPVDGCECVPPHIMDNALNQCVLPEDCGCHLEEEPGYIPVNNYIVSSDCTLKSTCVHKDGKSIVETEDLDSCNPAAHKQCVPDDEEGIYQCVCEDGYKTTPDGCKLIGYCEMGHYFNNDTELCMPCSPGAFTDVEGSMSCQLCGAGEFQPNSGATECEPCPSGQFSTTKGSAQCQPCSPGTYQSNPGRTSCDNCMAGTYSGSGAAACTSCDDGTISDDGLLCHSCKAGTYSTVDHTECRECQAGTYSIAKSSICTQCFPGKFQDQSGQDSCLQCPIGRVSLSQGATSCTQCDIGMVANPDQSKCIYCGPGEIPNADQSNCEKCSLGYISTGNGMTACSPCPAGMASDMTQSVCEPCRPGYFSNVEALDECLPCPAGEYQPNEGQEGCVVCDNGHFSDEGKELCQSCDPGTEPNVDKTECIQCPAGEFSMGKEECHECASGKVPNQDQSACTACTEGHVAVPGNSSCSSCNLGSEPNSDKSACTPCAPGYYSTGVECQACPAGKIPNIDNSECVACPSGHTAAVGSVTCTACGFGEKPNADHSACVACPDGYVAMEKSDTCIPCPPAQGPNADKSACQDCSPGYVSSGSSACTPCMVGTQPNDESTSCDPCPQGYASRGAMAGDLSCIQCSAGQEVIADRSECVSCQAGYVSMGTQEDCTKCAAGQQPDTNSAFCEDCPMGHISTDGTVCAPCGSDSIPNDGQTMCEICPTGTSPNEEATGCEPPSNPCDPSPCNAGTCTVSVNNQGYTCTCQPWMTGPNCEERIVLPAAPPGGVEPEPVIPKPPGLSEGGSPTVPESPSGGAAPGGGSPTGPLEGAPGGLAPSGELPGAGGFPQGPGGLPGSGGQPQEPGTPETGGQPQVPGAPGTGGQPQGPGVPGTGGQPQGPGAPGKGSQPQGQGGLSPPGGLPGSEESPEPTLASPGQPGGPVQPARNPFQRGCPPGQEQRPILVGSCVKCEPGYFKAEPGHFACKRCNNPAMPFASNDRRRCIGACEIAEPCQNGGSCYNVQKHGRKYICICPRGYSGDNCDVIPTPPPPPPPTSTPRVTGAPSPTSPPEPKGPLIWKPQPVPGRECIEDDDPHGLRYAGTMSTTTSGIICQEWTSMSPHAHGYGSMMKPTQINYCRNPGNLDLPWCFTTDPDVKWQYCNIPYCSKINETPQVPPEDKGCYYRSDNATTYVGPVFYTLSGKRCANWKEASNNMYNYDDNLCRNPTPHVRDKPWCFTDGPDSCIEFCDVRDCPSPPPDPEDHPCIVKEEISLCETKTTLEGNCFYQSGFNDVCDFTVVMNNRQEFTVYLDGNGPNGPVHELHWNAIGARESFTDQRCGTRYHVEQFNKITIRRQLCAQCATKSLESFMKDIRMGQKSCPAP